MQKGITVTADELVALRGPARGLELGSRRKAMAAEAGGFHSVYRGRGLEFDEVRLYQPGDDARTIDWRVTARRGKVHTKLFREERERPVFILVDLHPGMYFGTRTAFKSVVACRVAALLAWAAERAGHRVGGVVSSATGLTEIQPRARRDGVLQLIGELGKLQPTAPGELQYGRMDEALARLNKVVNHGSLVLILSDFQEMGDDADRYLTAMARHNDVIAGLVFDPLEAQPPRRGVLEIGTAQSRNIVDFGRSRSVHGWQQRFATHLQYVNDTCRRHRVSMFDIATNDDLLRTLTSGLAGRRIQR